MGMKNSRWLSLLVLCTGFLLIVVDMTIVNVALPSIQKDLGFTQSGLAWVVNAYLIAFGGLLLLAGRVRDLVGRKRVYLAGLVIFTTSSVMVAWALMLGVYTIVQPSDHGLVSVRTAVLGAVAVALLAAFVVRQARGRNPILPLRLLRSRKVAGSNLVQALMSTAFLGFFFLGSLDLERVQGYGPMAIGLAFLPVAVVVALFSVRLSAQLIARLGPGAMPVARQAVAMIAVAAGAGRPGPPPY